MSVLEAIRVEREELLAPIKDKLDQLDALEELAREFEGEPGGDEAARGRKAARVSPAVMKPPAASPRRKPNSGPARDGMTNGAEKVLRAVRGGATTKSEVIAASGMSSSGAGKHLQMLVNKRLVVAEGSTKARRYTPAVIDQEKPPPKPATKPAAKSNGNGASNGSAQDREYLIRRLVTELARAPLSPEQAAKAIDAPVDDVQAVCHELVRRGTASLMDDGRYVA